jgi:hypothetical protein
LPCIMMHWGLMQSNNFLKSKCTYHGIFNLFVNIKLFKPNAWSFNAVLQCMLRVKLRQEFTMIVLMVKLKAFQRYVFVVMVW